MLQQDYILRLIRRAARFMARAMGRKELPPDHAELDEAAREWTGLPLDLLELIDLASIRASLGEGTRASAQAAAVGMLLAGRARQLGVDGGQGRAVLEKALALMIGARAELGMELAELDAAIEEARAALGSEGVAPR